MLANRLCRCLGTTATTPGLARARARPSALLWRPRPRWAAAGCCCDGNMTRNWDWTVQKMWCIQVVHRVLSQLIQALPFPPSVMLQPASRAQPRRRAGAAGTSASDAPHLRSSHWVLRLGCARSWPVPARGSGQARPGPRDRDSDDSDAPDCCMGRPRPVLAGRPDPALVTQRVRRERWEHLIRKSHPTPKLI